MGGNQSSFNPKEGDELSTPPPPPPGAMLLQAAPASDEGPERLWGTLQIATLTTSLNPTPEVIAEKKKKSEECGGLWGCPPWGRTYYPDGNPPLIFREPENALLASQWPDAWQAIQPNLIQQVDEVTRSLWMEKPAQCCSEGEGGFYGWHNQPCFNNNAVHLLGGGFVNPTAGVWRNEPGKDGRRAMDLLAASPWLTKLNEVLRPHGLVADLYLRQTNHVEEHTSTSHDGEGNASGSSTSYSNWTGNDIVLRFFLWSAAVAQTPPPPTPMVNVAVPPGVGAGAMVTAMGPDGKQYTMAVPPGVMPGQTFMFQLPAQPAPAPMAPPPANLAVSVPAGVAPGQMIMAPGPDGRQYSLAVPPGVAPGQTVAMQLPQDAAWWRSVMGLQVGPNEMVRG